MKISIITILMFCLISFEAYSQCSCIGGAAVGGLTPVGGTVNIGVLREGFFRSTAFYRYSGGENYFRGDIPAEKGIIDSYHIQYLGLVLGYGISNRFTIEAELGAFPQKYQDYKLYSLSGGGMSHILISGKYNLYYNVKSEFEVTIGIGGRLPLVTHDENLPQHILPSTGAYGIALQAFLHKGYKDHGLRFILIHRTDINSENNSNYKYGTGFYTSFYTAINIVDELTGILEIRNEYRTKDEFMGEIYDDSGGNIFVISPQLNYVISDFNISVLFDYPIYKYYNGYQLANDYSIAMNLTWQINLL
jgi:hypothetical protein